MPSPEPDTLEPQITQLLQKETLNQDSHCLARPTSCVPWEGVCPDLVRLVLWQVGQRDSKHLPLSCRP